MNRLNLVGARELLDVSQLRPVFARHETFHPRFGWLKKGFDKAIERPDVFLREDTPVILGVGKNMVRSIRYWSLAFKTLQEEQSGRRNASSLVPTELGLDLLDNQGWDPFLEHPCSLWWLHWNLLKLPCQATSWYYTFFGFHKFEFSTSDLTRQLSEYVELHFPGFSVVEASLKKDVNCILRMYGDQGTSITEDSIDCPFAALELIKRAPEKKNYFVMGHKPGLSPEIVAAACMEFADKYASGSRTLSLSSLLYDIGSPGMAFKLTEEAMCEAIDRVSSRFNSIRLGDSSGAIQLSYPSNPHLLVRKLLDRAYQ